MRILTFDVEDWYHLLDLDCIADENQWRKYQSRIHGGVERIMQILNDHECRASFFCLGWIAEKYPEVVRLIASEGHEIGSHTHTHQLVYEQTPSQFRQDVERSIQVIEDRIGKKVSFFRAPGFSITPGMPWAFETLVELGIEHDSSIFPMPRGHGGFKNFGTDQPSLIECNNGILKEYPINLASFIGKKFVFSGGGYFRLLPYFLINKYSSDASYMMTYFHPRDFDPDQPRLRLSLNRRFKSYVGIKGAMNKLNRLLCGFDFIDISAADSEINWMHAPKIVIKDALK